MRTQRTGTGTDTAARGGRRARAGFTMIELLAASAAGAVLALTAGSLIYFVSSVQSRNSGNQEVQRDATFAMDLLGRTVQASRAREVTLTSGQIDFSTNHVRACGVQFRSDSRQNLMYDPDVSTAGDEVRVVRGRLAAFSASVSSNRMWIVLGLREGAASLYMTNGFTFRNGT